jgi:hypothetical protein
MYMQNFRTPSELKAALDAIVLELAVVAENTTFIAADDLVPLAKAVQAVAEFVPVIGKEIMQRVVVDGVCIPGAVRKLSVTHRKWHDPAVVADLAFKSFGLSAFKLESPAALEKLGDEGKALVAVASYKPKATDCVVY